MNFFKNFSKPIIIAEIGLAHEGSLGNCFQMIDECKKSGADVVKFQIHFAEEESTLDEKFRIKFSVEDKNRFDYWKRTSFNEKQWQKIYNYCKKKNIKFLASIFSVKAFKMLYSFGVRCFKVSSGEIHNNEILNILIKKKCELIISNGMIDDKQLHNKIKIFKRKKINFSLLECTTKYPTPPENINIKNVAWLRRRYNCHSGLSDHSGEIYPSIGALILGAKLVEVHVCFNKEMFGPDIKSSLTFNQLKELAIARDWVYSMMNFKSKNVNTKILKDLFGRSISLNKNKLKGDKIYLEDIIMKKPGTGFQQHQISEIVGKKLKRNYINNRILTKKDIKVS